MSVKSVQLDLDAKLVLSKHASSVRKVLQSCVPRPQTIVRCVHNYYPQETSQKPFWDVVTHHDVTLGTLHKDFQVPRHGSWLRLGISNSITSFSDHAISRGLKSSIVRKGGKVNLCDDGLRFAAGETSRMRKMKATLLLSLDRFPWLPCRIPVNCKALRLFFGCVT